MKIVTAQQMQQLDQQAIEEYGIPGLILMENAGSGVLREMERHYGRCAGKVVTVVAGSGNNGGDGLVIARHLLQKGNTVHVFLLGSSKSAKSDARTNLQIYQKIGGVTHRLTTPGQLETLREHLRHSNLIVDAIWGTGLNRTRTGQTGEIIPRVIALIHSVSTPVVSVDIPSGICSDTGEMVGNAVQADLTVTFGLPKRGHYLYPGAAHRGTLKVIDIGFPSALIETIPAGLQLLDREEVRGTLPSRTPDAHKGKYGHILVIAGSVGKTGAASLASVSALRVGAGLVTLALPASLNPVLERKLTEVMTHPVAETPAQTLSTSAEKELLELARNKSAVVLGPGLSTHQETQALIRKLIQSIEVPIILDADGINALSGHLEPLKASRAPVILTPHPGEMSRLLDLSSPQIQNDRLGHAGRFSREHRVWLVLKGALTILADPEGSLSINPTGNEGMATGGTGDVLSGVLGGLLAQGLPPSEAMKTGTYLHGLAGDLAASQKGTMGLIASDIIDKLPQALQWIQDASQPSDSYHPFSP